MTGYMLGGVATAVRDLLLGLCGNGHEVGLVNDVPYRGTAELVRHFPLSRSTPELLAEATEEALKAFRPDIVHVVATGQRVLTSLSRVLRGRPWLVTVHSVPPFECIVKGLHGVDALHYKARGLRFGLNAVGWKRLLRTGEVAHVVVHSEAMRATLLQYGQPERKLSVIPLAYPGLLGRDAPSAMPPQRRRPTIVTVAGFAHTKGQHDALKAIHVLRTEYPELEYRMTGEVRDRTYMRYLQGLVRDLKLDQSAAFGESVSDSDRDAWLQSADLYVQPSHEEGFCLAFLEAAYRSPRLLGTATGAMPEIASGDRTMSVVRPRDPTSMASAMSRLLRMPVPDSVELAARCKRLDGRYAMSQYVSGFEQLYERLIGTGATGDARVRETRSRSSSGTGSDRPIQV